MRTLKTVAPRRGGIRGPDLTSSLSPQHWSALADAVLAAHIAVVAFVVLGQFAILGGGALGASWVRDLRLRLAHLALIIFIAVETWLGQVCPLTQLERSLRLRAGQASYSESFTQHWLSHLIYLDAPWWVFTALHTLAAVIVVASWIVIRPHAGPLQRSLT